MKLAEKLEYLQTTNMSIWLETRTKVFEELSDKYHSYAFVAICHLDFTREVVLNLTIKLLAKPSSD